MFFAVFSLNARKQQLKLSRIPHSAPNSFYEAPNNRPSMARRILSRGIAVIIISFIVVASSVVAGYGGVDNNDESQEQQHRISSRFTSALNLVGNDVGPSSPSSLRAAVPEEEDEDDTMIMGDGISSRGSSSRQRRELSWWSIVIQARK